MNSFPLNDKYSFTDFPANELEKLRSEVYEALDIELNRLPIDKSNVAIGIPDAGDDGTICFHDENGMWVFYIAERGQRFGQAFFSSAWDGANFLVWQLTANPNNGNSDVGQIPRATQAPQNT